MSTRPSSRPLRCLLLSAERESASPTVQTRRLLACFSGVVVDVTPDFRAEQQVS